MFDRKLLLQHIYNHDVNTKNIRESSWQTTGLGGGGFGAGDPGAPMQGHVGHPSDMRDKMQYKFENGAYTFPISLHPEKGWVYGSDGMHTMEVSSQHKPEIIGTEVSSGHPHHMKLLSDVVAKSKDYMKSGDGSKLEEQNAGVLRMGGRTSLISYANTLADRSRAKFGSPTNSMRATGSGSSVASTPGYGSSNLLFSRTENNVDRYRRNRALDKGLANPDRLNFVQGRWQRGRGDGTRLVFKGGKWQRIPVRQAAEFISRTQGINLDIDKVVDRYGTNETETPNVSQNP